MYTPLQGLGGSGRGGGRTQSRAQLPKARSPPRRPWSPRHQSQMTRCDEFSASRSWQRLRASFPRGSCSRRSSFRRVKTTTRGAGGSRDERDPRDEAPHGSPPPGVSGLAEPRRARFKACFALVLTGYDLWHAPRRRVLVFGVVRRPYATSTSTARSKPSPIVCPRARFSQASPPLCGLAPLLSIGKGGCREPPHD